MAVLDVANLTEQTNDLFNLVTEMDGAHLHTPEEIRREVESCDLDPIIVASQISETVEFVAVDVSNTLADAQRIQELLWFHAYVGKTCTTEEAATATSLIHRVVKQWLDSTAVKQPMLELWKEECRLHGQDVSGWDTWPQWVTTLKEAEQQLSSAIANSKQEQGP